MLIWVGTLFPQGTGAGFPSLLGLMGIPVRGVGKNPIRDLENSNFFEYNPSNKKTPQGG